MVESPRDRRRKYLLFSLFVFLVVVSVVTVIVFPMIQNIILIHIPSSEPNDELVTMINGEPIGISDGSYAFDTERSDGDLKRQASVKFRKRDFIGAKSLWEQAIAKDPNDAEVLIYQEDQRIRESGQPYITLVVGTILTDKNGSNQSSKVSTGRDNLQGSYIAQKEYNNGFKLDGGVQVLLLIANSGDDPEDATTAAQRIVHAKQGQHIVGIMGWSFSQYALNAVQVLSKADIPMVSSTASTDKLSGISPYFFRVAPPNKSQAVAAARYAEQQWHASHVALFVDPNDAYSSSLADDFKQQFVTDGNQIIDTEKYTVGDKAALPALLQKALLSNPDLIYFAGYADDMSVLLTNLGTSYPQLKLMGGDTLYELKGYPWSARAGFTRLNFTAFAYPDEWDILGLGSQKPTFFTTYPHTFDPDQSHTANPYGYTRPTDKVILSYDAMVVLLEASKNALAGGKTSLTTEALRQSIAGINRSHPIQGVSGRIAFGPDGDPIDKAIVILSVDPAGHIQLLNEDRVRGCFLAAHCQGSHWRSWI